MNKKNLLLTILSEHNANCIRAQLTAGKPVVPLPCLLLFRASIFLRIQSDPILHCQNLNNSLCWHDTVCICCRRKLYSDNPRATKQSSHISLSLKYIVQSALNFVWFVLGPIDFAEFRAELVGWTITMSLLTTLKIAGVYAEIFPHLSRWTNGF